MSKSWMILIRMIAFVAFVWFTKPLRGDESPPEAFAVFRLVHPDRQAAAVIRLFEGCRAPHPAAALASWKRATRDPDQIGKPLEAVIAFMNPEMVREWGAFHDAELRLGLDSRTGTVNWRVVVPHDDGGVSALITSLRLTGGQGESPLNGGKVLVERLGGPGAAVAAQLDGAVAVASSRPELSRALEQLAGDSTSRDEPKAEGETNRHVQNPASGIFFKIDPNRITRSDRQPVEFRRLAEAARGLGSSAIAGYLGLQGEILTLNSTSSLDPTSGFARVRAQTSPIDPDWLKWVPAKNALGVVAVALNRDPAFWDGAFALADRVERSDPARAQVAPLRTRLNLMASAAGVQLEVDLWPRLHGLTFAVFDEPSASRNMERAILVLHADSPQAAEQIANVVVPRMAGFLGSRGATEKTDRTGIRSLGLAAGRPLAVTHQRSTVLVGLGDGVLATCLDAAEHPERTVSPVITTGWTAPRGSIPHRVAALWPGRISLPIKGWDPSSPGVQSLANGPPVVWWSWDEPGQTHDLARWGELTGLVHRFLEAIPLDTASVP